MWVLWLGLGFGAFVVVGIPVLGTLLSIRRVREARKWGQDSGATKPDATRDAWSRPVPLWWLYPPGMARPREPYDPTKKD
jgi:hypothetical protein